ncbi:MAG TPA: hypothetical protein VN739_07835 [Nitrososphaerales archaeon]|nr:hypothetical protein [Nitrososphaerales archaeon]
MTAKEVKIMVDRVLGAVSLFSQGGSLRLILPKSAIRALGTKIDRHSEDDDSDKSTFVVLATNKGLILRSLQDYLNDDEMKLSNSSC